MKYCERVFKGIYCMPGGNVSLCSWTDTVIGNILEESLESIWHGEKAEKVRSSIKDGSFRYCRKTSCPFCENNSLPEITPEELKDKKAADLPTYYNIANDLICNHSCPSCRSGVFASNKAYQKKLKQCLDILFPYICKARHVSLNGAGEVFSNPMMIDVLEKLKPEFPGFKLSLETNGALFNRQNWEKIQHLSRYPIHVTVTPNSFVKETHAYLAGGHKDYDRVMENLYFLKELRSQNLIQYYQIAIVVQDRNFSELLAFVDRCIHDFEVDQVTVRPLYKWFYMSEESYWFKDIMNPCHPYHKEYLEILNNPVLDHPKIYLWGARNIHEAKPHPAYKYRELLKIAKELLMLPDPGNALGSFIKSKGSTDVIVYGDNDLAHIICRVLFNTDIKVKYILARDFSYEAGDESRILTKKLIDYSPSECDIILVSNYYDKPFIERDLSFKNFNGQLLDIQEAIRELKE